MDVRLPEPLSFSGNVAENFRRFKQSFEIYMVASGKCEKEDKIKIALLLNLLGEEGLEVFNTLKLTEVQKSNYDTVLAELEQYLTPKRNVVYERFLFYKRKQEEGESFDHFLTDLKKLSQSCEFGAASNDSMIRDRIVLGINSKELQEKLLHMEDLNLNRAIRICRANELAKVQLREVQEQCSAEAVKVDQLNKGSKTGFQRAKVPAAEGGYQRDNRGGELYQCGRCGRKHGPRQCQAYGRRCQKCAQYGHFARFCKSTRGNVRLVKEVQEQEPNTDTEDEKDQAFLVCTIKVSEVKSNHEWMEKLVLNGVCPIQFKIDTGSQVNIISINVLKRLHDKTIPILNTKLILETFGGFFDNTCRSSILRL